jgi:hypothetical protein
MKTQVLKLKSPKILKVYGMVNLTAEVSTTSQNSDPTGYCTTVGTSTHIFKV